MFWGAGIIVFPLMLVCTVISYTVFRGKVKPTADHYCSRQGPTMMGLHQTSSAPLQFAGAIQ
jgi:hypothetical protein